MQGLGLMKGRDNKAPLDNQVILQFMNRPVWTKLVNLQRAFDRREKILFMHTRKWAVEVLWKHVLKWENMCFSMWKTRENKYEHKNFSLTKVFMQSFVQVQYIVK